MNDVEILKILEKDVYIFLLLSYFETEENSLTIFDGQ